MKRALITGVTGQDGSFLAELLLDKGYQVFGLVREERWSQPHCASHLTSRVVPLFADFSEVGDFGGVLEEARPDEIYNLASQSRPGASWTRPAETLLVNGLGSLRLFEAVRQRAPQARVYHASSSEMFGEASACPQNEETPFNPVNPYAAAKVYAHEMARIYRRSYRLHISCGLLFNHESERRPLHFVTQKIAYGAACAGMGIADSPDLNEKGRPIVERGKLALGNLQVARDWGYAPDFVRAMWMIVQHGEADDFVIGTGKLHTLRSLCEAAYRCVDLDWRDHVITDPALVRPIETGKTVADCSKAERVLGWRPTVTFDEMVARMVAAQRDRLRANAPKKTIQERQ